LVDDTYFDLFDWFPLVATALKTTGLLI